MSRRRVTPHRPQLLVFLCHIVVGVASAIVPAPARRRWRREWTAEFSAWGTDTGTREGSLGKLVRRLSIAIADAFDARSVERNGAFGATSRSSGPLGTGRRLAILEDLGRDVRFGIRALRNEPGFAVLAVLTIGLGIGATTTMFSIVNGVLLAPLPYPDSDRIVEVGKASPNGDRLYALSALDSFDIKARDRSFESFAVSGITGLTLREDEGATVLRGAMVSASYFDVLGVRPAWGRAFTTAEDAPGAEPVVILSHGLWQRRWGADQGVIGSTLMFGTTPFTVVGIMPPGFFPPEAIGQKGVELWLPFSLAPEDARANRRNGFLQSIARLRPEATVASAAAELEGIGSDLSGEFPEAGDRSFGLSPLHHETTGQVGETLVPLFGAVGVLLLIACLNVANLLLVRGSRRGREMLVRTAIGAHRGRIVRQLVAEGAILGLAGGIVGTSLAVVGVRAFLGFGPTDLPRLGEVTVNGSVLAFAVLASMLTSLAFGLFPALLATRSDLAAGLRTGAGGTDTTVSRQRLRGGLVVAETALAVVLVVGAGLLVNSFLRLQRVDLGFDHDNAHVLAVAHRGASSPEEVDAFFADLMGRIAALPGVASVGATSDLALSGAYSMWSLQAIEGGEVPVDADDRPYSAYYQHVTPDFFTAMGVPLRRGRSFNADDRPETPRVVIVNEAMARDLFGNADPLGRRLRFNDETEDTYEIVGVAADVRHLRVEEAAAPTMYLSFDQAPRPWMEIIARSSDAEPGLLAAMRAQLREIRTDLPIRRLVLMQDLVSEALAGPRFYTVLLGGFAALALLLAIVGVYGTLAYTVSLRSHEVGIRMALGAGTGSVRAMVLRHGMTLVACGVVVGTGAALLATRALEAFVFGISTTDATTLALGVATVLGAAFVATIIPARRAARLDPLAVLRRD